MTALAAGAAGPILGPIQPVGGFNALSAFPHVDLDGQRAVAVFDIFDSTTLKSGTYRRYSTDDLWAATSNGRNPRVRRRIGTY